MSPRALVTGGAGFIGSPPPPELPAPRWRVEGLGDLSTGRRRNIERLEANPCFFFVYGSATDAPTLARLIPRSDVVFHLAAAGGVKVIVDQPVQTIATNTKAPELVLELA